MANVLGCGEDESAKPASLDDMYGIWEGMMYTTWNDGRHGADSLGLFIRDYGNDRITVYIGHEYHPSELITLTATRISFSFTSWIGPYEMIWTYCAGKRSGKVMTGTLSSTGYNVGEWYVTKVELWHDQ